MGFADMIPGISGGTIALILGIYHQFLSSFKNINFKALSKLNLKEFFSSDIKFLINLFLGIAFSFLCFSRILNFLISHEFSRTMLFSFFGGLVSASIFFLLKEIQFTFTRIIFLLFGGMLAFLLAYFGNNNLDISFDLPIKLIISGILATFAMLLPGISGSFVLLLLGVYPFIINALANVHSFDNIKILFFLSVGIGIGFLIFPRMILFLLNRFYFPVLTSLIGLMIGSLYILWPFWSYKKVVFMNKAFLMCDKFKMPQINSIEFFFSFIPEELQNLVT